MVRHLIVAASSSIWQSSVAYYWQRDPLNDWITGQIWAVDGGLSRVRPEVRA